jgi:hypothetical protein
MRKFFTPVTLAVLLLAGASPAMADARICINTRDITSSKPDKDGSSILFKMRDGTQWRNTLQGRCPDLAYEGFAWSVRNPDNSVCENEESLKVLQSAEVCQLGKFEKVTPMPKAG